MSISGDLRCAHDNFVGLTELSCTDKYVSKTWCINKCGNSCHAWWLQFHPTHASTWCQIGIGLTPVFEITQHHEARNEDYSWIYLLPATASSLPEIQSRRCWDVRYTSKVHPGGMRIGHVMLDFDILHYVVSTYFTFEQGCVWQQHMQGTGVMVWLIAWRRSFADYNRYKLDYLLWMIGIRTAGKGTCLLQFESVVFLASSLNGCHMLHAMLGA